MKILSFASNPNRITYDVVYKNGSRKNVEYQFVHTCPLHKVYLEKIVTVGNAFTFEPILIREWTEKEIKKHKENRLFDCFSVKYILRVFCFSQLSMLPPPLVSLPS